MRTRFRGITVREGVLLAGLPSRRGWGEWSPFLEYDAAVAEPWLRCAEEAAAGRLAGAGARLGAGQRDRAGRRRPSGRTRSCSPAAARTAKVKVAEPGQTLADDQARLEAVRDALGPGGRIRVDANGGWDVDEAVAAIRLLDRAAGGLEYVEQPCASVEELAAVRRAVDVPIAADESIRRAADPYRVRDLEAADVAVLKVQPLGGVRACLRIAEDIGLPVVVSSALETSRRDRGRAWPWRPRCPSCPTPAAWPRCSCSPPTWSPRRCCRSTARCRSPGRSWTRRRWPRSPPRRTGSRTGRPGWPRCGRPGAVRKDGRS